MRKSRADMIAHRIEKVGLSHSGRPANEKWVVVLLAWIFGNAERRGMRELVVTSHHESRKRVVRIEHVPLRAEGTGHHSRLDPAWRGSCHLQFVIVA